jgi:ABC-type phosphate/phosphonate transport system substrate-binding protein
MSTLMLAAVATLVFVAPGYPGGAGDAQPYVDQFAKSAAAAAGWEPGSLVAVYDPTEQGGLAKLSDKDAVLTFVPYAFYVQHATALKLKPLAQAELVGVGAQERWTLVGKAGGTVSGPASMSGYTILSVAGYAPDFVKHSALAAWALLPADTKIEASGQILSTLRRVASGDPVVALLDQTQSAALPTLPFAAQLKTLTQSEPLPVALIAVVDSRLPAPRAKAFQTALLKMNAAGGADTLASLRLKGFVLPQLPGKPD